MLESAIGGIAVPVFEGIWKAGGFAVNQIKDASQKTEAVQKVLKASQQYEATYREHRGQVKVMPGLMKEPVPLDWIYTAVKFLDEDTIRYFATQDALEQAYRKRGKRSFQSDDERHDGMCVAKEKQYLMVLGGPGVGKSTFLRKLGLEALRGKSGQLQSEQIPIFVELKTLRSSDIDLKAIIAKEFEICGFPEAETFTASTLNQGKLLILLDGLDEVPTHNLNPVIEHIENFVTQYSTNTFVASCRTAAYHSSFQRFADVTIADFDDEQIEQFIRRWFDAKLDKDVEVADHYWELLQKPENVAAKELAQTPLLLTFLCLVYDREQILPSNRSTLYGDALNILLKEWSAQKRLERDPIYEGFHPTLEKELLSEIAYKSFEEDRLFFSTSEITERITSFLADTLDAEHLDSEAVLKAIEKQQGILVERATDTYSFSHLTLQEYLTALYIVNNQLVQELVSRYLGYGRWREVFLLVTGLMGRRSHELLEAIDQQARTYITGHPKICDLVRWSDRVTQGSALELKAFAKRVAVIDIARAIARASDTEIARASDAVKLRILAIAGAITRVFAAYIFGDDISLAIINIQHNAIDTIDNNDATDVVNAIDRSIKGVNGLIKKQIFNVQALDDLPEQLRLLKKKIPQLTAPADDWCRYYSELENTWLTAFELTSEVISLSEEEWQAFIEYLYANELLLRCKRSSIGLSRRAWEALEERLLKL